MYLVWHDDSRRSLEEKITAAIAAYTARYGTRPGVVLCHAEQCLQRSDVQVIAGAERGVVVRPNLFFVGAS